MLAPLSNGLARTHAHAVLFLLPPRHPRCYSQLAKPPPAPRPSPVAQSEHPGAAQTQAVRYPYVVPRNSRGALPVYSEYRSSGRPRRYLVLIRNIQGDKDALRSDLAATLFTPESEDAARLSIDASRPRALVLSGGRWVTDVKDWLQRRGF